MPTCLTTLAVAGILIGLYTLIGDIRATYVSRFRFYLVTAILLYIPIILLLSHFLIFQELSNLSFVVIVFVTPAVLIWRNLQIHKNRELHPLEWAAWESVAKHAGFWDRLLLLRRRV